MYAVEIEVEKGDDWRMSSAAAVTGPRRPRAVGAAAAAAVVNRLLLLVCWVPNTNPTELCCLKRLRSRRR